MDSSVCQGEKMKEDPAGDMAGKSEIFGEGATSLV